MSPRGGDDLGGIPYCQKRIPATKVKPDAAQ